MCVAYPELCPTPKCDPAYGSDVLDPSSNATLPAMQAVVDALVAAGVDSVLHLGGDEVGDACWLASPAVRAWMAANNATTGDDIYGYFVEKSNEMALAAGKSPMRWEEVWKHFGTELDRRVIVHAWLSSAALFDAANHGYRTVYSVNDQAYYLDYLDVQWSQVYATDILAGMTNSSARPFVLGGQVCACECAAFLPRPPRRVSASHTRHSLPCRPSLPRAGGETMDAASVLSIVWPRAAAAAERLWSYNFATSSATDFDTVNRMAAFRCELLERGVPAPLPGASNAGDLRPAWTVGSCDGGYKALC